MCVCVRLNVFQASAIPFVAYGFWIKLCDSAVWSFHMAVDLALMRSSYARIQLYERLHGAVLAVAWRTKELQNLTKEVGDALLEIEMHMDQLEATPVRHYGSKIEQIHKAYTKAGPVVEDACDCIKGI